MAWTLHRARALATLRAPHAITEAVKRIVLTLLLLAYLLTFPIRFPIRVLRELTKSG